MPRFTTSSLRFVIPTALVVISVAGCSGTDLASPASSTLPGPPAATSTTQTSTTAKAGDVDYREFLLTADDLSDPQDTFKQRSSEAQPNGQAGATAFFVNGEDTRAIIDTVLIYPDAASATATLQQVAGNLTSLVEGGTPTPAPVGADGVMIVGTNPDDDKAVTMLLFTQGPALVRLEFQSATGDATTDQFVTSVAKMQLIALRVGLADPQ